MKATNFKTQLTEFWSKNWGSYPDCYGYAECEVPPVVLGSFRRSNGQVLRGVPLCWSCAGFPKTPVWLESAGDLKGRAW